jgi:hypothetical protein
VVLDSSSLTSLPIPWAIRHMCDDDDRGTLHEVSAEVLSRFIT